MSEERGPSWYDVSVYAEQLREAWGVYVYFKLVPPVRRVDGRGYTSWATVVELHDRGSAGSPAKCFQNAFGQGGVAKTAPGALYASLTQAEGFLEDRKEAAERQARF